MIEVIKSLMRNQNDDLPALFDLVGMWSMVSIMYYDEIVIELLCIPLRRIEIYQMLVRLPELFDLIMY
jgi:hypothetical protein